MSGNRAGRKVKAMTEINHGRKEQPGNMNALKLITKQRADEKA